ncbi:phage tail protein [Xanthobacter sediminis]
MLLQIGTVMFRANRGASLDGLSRKTDAALAEKGLLSGLPGHEWTGWAADITVSGTVLPFHLGGLDDVDTLHGWAADGTAVPVIRGDGRNLGWHAIASVSEGHKTLARNGIGYEVDWTVRLVQVQRPSTSSLDSLIGRVSGLVGQVTSLFG